MMNSLLELWLQYEWRATWQSAALVVLIGLVCWGLRGRIAPRWQYLLWSLVLVRLLVIVTPPSPWSAFNWIGREITTSASSESNSAARAATSAEPAYLPRSSMNRAPQPAQPLPDRRMEKTESFVAFAADRSSGKQASSMTEALPSPEHFIPPAGLVTTAVGLWAAGCLFFFMRYGLAWTNLRRRLACCRSVMDPAILASFERAKSTMGIRSSRLKLLVAPGPMSPFVVGTWRPSIVVPESILASFRTRQIELVLAHELAHVRRGDVWIQWPAIIVQAVHWFNPFSWFAGRAMCLTREVACDDLVIQRYRGSCGDLYAETLLAVSAHLHPLPLTPGLIGFFSRRRAVMGRVRRLASPNRPAGQKARTGIALVTAFILLGLTDKMPTARRDLRAAAPGVAHSGKSSAPLRQQDNLQRTFIISGKCLSGKEPAPVPGVTVRLLASHGLVGAPKVVGTTVSGDDGAFKFEPVEPPTQLRTARLRYDLIAETPGYSVRVQMVSGHEDPTQTNLYLSGPSSTLKGTVVDVDGKPIAGANVTPSFLLTGAVPGVPSAVSDAKGRFELTRVREVNSQQSPSIPLTVQVEHPEFPVLSFPVLQVPGIARLVLSAGCVLEGSVRDAGNGGGVARVVVTATPVDSGTELHTLTDANGRYRIVVPEGNYVIVLDEPDMVAAGIPNLECKAGDTLTLAPLLSGPGGRIVGKVINAETKQPMVLTSQGNRIALGVYGPARPPQRVIRQRMLARVDDHGRFQLRVAAGENFPYFTNIHGDRMAWDTRKQPPIIVADGEATECTLTITPPQTPQEKLAAAQEIVDKLPHQTSDRVGAIIEAYRQLNHTVDETETWCLLMKELVQVGPAAVPALCDELEATSQPFMMRRLAFALRAIGDPRAVPSLIRVLPKTLQPASSDYALTVEDPKLAEFMQKHSVRGGGGGKFFSLGRAVRETHSALTRLTGRMTDARELFTMFRRADPRSAAEQEVYYYRAAADWADWWESHWRQFGVADGFRSVRLPEYRRPELSDLPVGLAISDRAEVDRGTSGLVLSPVGERDEGSRFFLDLDTGRCLRWPQHLQRDDTAAAIRDSVAWAKSQGVDLICVAAKDRDPELPYALIGIDLKAWEISPLDAKNIGTRVAAGKLPAGRKVDVEGLLHYDPVDKRYFPKRNSSFLYLTREEGLGVMTITDFVTKVVKDGGGWAYSAPPPGVGFHRGVRLDYKPISR